jgi:uncharacterized membrane protein YeaQ/YmgE (transglycosylase-associated protein family)
MRPCRSPLGRSAALHSPAARSTASAIVLRSIKVRTHANGESVHIEHRRSQGPAVAFNPRAPADVSKFGQLSTPARRNHQSCNVDTSFLLQQLNVRLPHTQAVGTDGNSVCTRPKRGESSRTLNLEHGKMHMSGESLLIILVVGLIAGWLAGQIVRGTGFGIVGDLIIGIIGAFIGGWLLPQLGIHLGVGIVGAIINATIGALILLLIISLVRGGGGWGARWSGGWGRR